MPLGAITTEPRRAIATPTQRLTSESTLGSSIARQLCLVVLSSLMQWASPHLDARTSIPTGLPVATVDGERRTVRVLTGRRRDAACPNG